jgi:hypothetical protein
MCVEFIEQSTGGILVDAFPPRASTQRMLNEAVSVVNSRGPWEGCSRDNRFKTLDMASDEAAICGENIYSLRAEAGIIAYFSFSASTRAPQERKQSINSHLSHKNFTTFRAILTSA